MYRDMKKRNYISPAQEILPATETNLLSGSKIVGPSSTKTLNIERCDGDSPSQLDGIDSEEDLL